VATGMDYLKDILTGHTIFLKKGKWFGWMSTGLASHCPLA